MHGLFSHINETIETHERRFNKISCAYSQDVRRRAIWLTEIMGFQIEELSERIISTDVKESDFSTFAEISSSRQCIGTYFKFIANESFMHWN